MNNLAQTQNSSAIEAQLDELLSKTNNNFQGTENRKLQDNDKQDSFYSQVLILKKSQPLYCKFSGESILSNSENVTEGQYANTNLIYDIGSLTRVIATSLIIYSLVEEGLLSYEHRISRYLPSFGTLGKERMTIGHFLSHTSGLPSSINLVRSVTQVSPRDIPDLSRRLAQDKLLKELLKVKISNLPGKVTEESMLGYIVLLYVIEQVTGLSFDKVYRKLIATPHGLKSLDFIDWEFLRREKFEPNLDVIVPTRFCSWRNKRIHGECSDELAWYLGGISTHSGLFGSLSDLSIVVQSILNAYKGNGTLFRGPLFKTKFDDFQASKSTSKAPQFNLFGLMQDLVSLEDKGELSWFGLDGDTGVSFWFEPKHEYIAILATSSNQKGKGSKVNIELSSKVRELLSRS